MDAQPPEPPSEPAFPAYRQELQAIEDRLASLISTIHSDIHATWIEAARLGPDSPAAQRLQGMLQFFEVELRHIGWEHQFVTSQLARAQEQERAAEDRARYEDQFKFNRAQVWVGLLSIGVANAIAIAALVVSILK